MISRFRFLKILAGALGALGLSPLPSTRPEGPEVGERHSGADPGWEPTDDFGIRNKVSIQYQEDGELRWVTWEDFESVQVYGERAIFIEDPRLTREYAESLARTLVDDHAWPRPPTEGIPTSELKRPT